MLLLLQSYHSFLCLWDRQVLEQLASIPALPHAAYNGIKALCRRTHTV